MSLIPEDDGTPEKRDGDPETCEGFIVQCELFFGYQPRLSNYAKASFVIWRLTGNARVWGAALGTNNSPLMNDYAGFIGELCLVFYQQGRLCGQSLLHLRQGSRSTANYAMEFQALIAGTRCNEPTQIDVFVNRLWAELQAELACRWEGNTLNEVVHLAIRYDRLLQEKRRCVQREAKQRTGAGPTWQTDMPEEPMQLDAAGVQ
ncbi:hypothetical protein P4O66_013805 [Electrophorus voltai]|uniref:DUF4939 domain-containing protein n=1 Tax=Electrophorus voltai TaxID=2609070 RepID=A0AAD8Z3L0_9TELE|nr:hypothetical protein P4O66_013805 [Electrophorus voltai]